MSINQAIHSLSPGSVINFLEVPLDDTTTFRCYNGYDTTQVAGVIEWENYQWVPVPFVVTDVEYDSTGKTTEPTIALMDTDTALLQWAFTTGDIRGLQVVRHKTLFEYLDGDAPLQTEVWVIDSIESNGHLLTIRLTTPLSLPNKKLPARTLTLKDFPAIGTLRIEE